MKKITLLILIFAVSIGYSQTLPFDFEGTIHGFAGDGGPGVTNNPPANDVLLITAGVADWDNAQVTFATPIDLSNDAVNTLRFTMQSTTAMAGEVHQHGVSFQDGGGAIEANFHTIGTDVTNVELNFQAGLGSRDKMVIFTDVGNFGAQSATGGQSGTPTNGLSGTYIIDNISLGFDPGTCLDGVLNNGEEQIDCGGPNCTPCAADTTPPTGFTAVAGAVGGTSVELLLNATDTESANITYDVTYDGGGTAQIMGASGVETSLVISNLMPETMYTFMVSASDDSGNQAANNAISVPATTGVNIALPFDFEGTTHGFSGDGGPGITNGPGNDVLEITAGVSDWDNVQVTFSSPIDLSDDANNTLRFTMQSTTAMPGEVHQHGVSFQDGGGAIEANFITTGTDVVNVELNFQAGLGSRDRMVIFTDVGNFGAQSATGGQSGTPTNGLSGTYIIDNITLGSDPETCSDGIMNQDETGVDCGGVCAPCDTTPPTSFTATAGTVNAFSVELLLNATDAESDIIYDVTYDGGGTAQITGTSGVETPLVISGLTPETMYTFMVSASDASGNPAANNAITVMATTGVDNSTACAGFSSEASEGAFSIGYNYSFVTEANGTDVTVTFEVLDTDKTGLVGEVFIAPSTFIGMTNNGSNNFSVTLTGQTPGADITFSGRFPYAGGLVRTKDFTYTVGDDCSGVANDDCASATLINLATEIAFDNSGSTDSGVDSCFTGVVSDLWYSFVVPTSGDVTITASGSTQYALFSDCSTQVSCNTSANAGLMAGATYYVAVTDDGSTTLVPGVGTLQVDDTATLSTEDFNISQFQVFPNPSKGNWTIKSNNTVINEVVIFDILGKQVLSLTPNKDEVMIDATSLNSGLYLTRITTNTGVKTIKLVKE